MFLIMLSIWIKKNKQTKKTIPRTICSKLSIWHNSLGKSILYRWLNWIRYSCLQAESFKLPASIWISKKTGVFLKKWGSLKNLSQEQQHYVH